MGTASPSRPSSSPLDLCPSLLTLCSPSSRPPCFYPGLCQWHCLWEKPRLDHLFVFFFFFLLDITINSPQLFAWHSRPPQSSPAYLPSLSTLPSALTLHCLGAVLRVHPDPCTVQSDLSTWNSFPAFITCHAGKPSPTLPPLGSCP